MSFSSLHIQECSIVSERWTQHIRKTSPLTFQTRQPEGQRTHDTAAICQKNWAWPSDVLYMYLMYMHLKSEEKIFNFLNFQNPLGVNLFYFIFFSLFFPPGSHIHYSGGITSNWMPVAIALRYGGSRVCVRRGGGCRENDRRGREGEWQSDIMTVYLGDG